MLRPVSNKLAGLGVLPDRHRQRRRHFLIAWIRSPLKVGALLPSSRALGRAMAAEIDLDKPGMVIELGGGTGAVTHALLSGGVLPERLVVIERDRKLYSVLAAQFPDVRVLCADAAELDRVLIDAGVTRVNAIVSSLPLLSMPRHVRHVIQEQMAASIGHDGRIVQFTYGPRSPIGPRQLHRHQLHGTRRKTVIGNIPPAHVWVYLKN